MAYLFTMRGRVIERWRYGLSGQGVVVLNQASTHWTQFSHLYNGDNYNAYLTGLLYELNELLHRKHLAQCLVHSKHPANVNYYYSFNEHF